MSLMKRTTLSLLVLGALAYTQVAQASCKRNPAAPIAKIMLDMGRIVVPPDAKVGDIIASRGFSTTGTTEYVYTCTQQTTLEFEAKLTHPNNEWRDSIYPTNIPGIGIRLRVGIGPNAVTYPGNYKVTGTKFTAKKWSTGVELVKIAEVTGGGSLDAGVYATYGRKGESSPVSESYISGNAITIVSPSCQFKSSKIMNVNLPSAQLHNFNGVGSKVGDKKFSIDLVCSGGTSISGYADVNTSFSGNQPTGYDSTTGVLINEDTSGSSAKGIGFIVQKDGNPISFNEKYLIGRLSNSSETLLSFPMSASYYQYDNDVSAGRVTSHMTYNITYD